jgi:hypothetical protein
MKAYKHVMIQVVRDVCTLIMYLFLCRATYRRKLMTRQRDNSLENGDGERDDLGEWDC